ncbi:hypothetical protein D3C87_1713080 [compost metagenome]
MLVGGLAGLRNPLPQFTDIDLSPLNKFNEPMLRLDLQPRSGPIVLQIDYETAEHDIPEFLTLMARRRRVRIRDGARQWALMRDLEHPEIWTETYHTATWADYVRHNRRRLQIDEEIWDAIRKLHKGVDGPRVHRMIERQTIPPKDDIFHKHHVDLH